MSVRVFSFLIILGTIFSWLTWLVVIFFLDPQQTGVLGFVTFYLSLLLAGIGTIFFISKWLRQKVSKKPVYIQVSTSLRQSIFFALLIIGGGILHRQNLLTWWNVIFLILTLTILELFFLIYNRQKRPPQIKVGNKSLSDDPFES